MMLRQKIATWIVLAICLFVAVGGALREASHTPQAPQHGSAAYNTNNPGHGTQQESTEQALARYNEYLAWFTGILAIATIMIGAINGFQLWLARAEFVSTHRPKIIVRQFQIDPIVYDQPITISFSVINAGDTTAFPRFAAGEVALWDVERQIYEAPGIDPVERPITVERVMTIESGERVTFSIVSRFQVSEAQCDAIDQHRFLIRCVGEITYLDERNIKRRTGFHRTYNSQSDIFAISRDPDQEYQD